MGEKMNVDKYDRIIKNAKELQIYISEKEYMKLSDIHIKMCIDVVRKYPELKTKKERYAKMKTIFVNLFKTKFLKGEYI